MSKIKVLIEPEKPDIEQILSNKLKKFSSERNLFFANIYGSDHNINNEKLSKFEKTTSFLKNEFRKKCKSLKDIYQQSQCESEIKALSSSGSTRHFDEFEKSYLFLGAKKNLVKELRKNFENDLHRSNNIENDHENNVQSVPFKKCEFSAVDIQKRLSLREKTKSELPPRKPIGRHSFYTHRKYGDCSNGINEPNTNNNNNNNNNNETLHGTYKSVNHSPITNVVGDDHNRVCLQQHDIDYKHQKTSMNGYGNISIGIKRFSDDLSNGSLVHDTRLQQIYMQNNSVKIRKCNSMYQIDLDLLKKELDDFTYYKLKTINRNYGLLSLRGQLRKVS